MRELPPCKMQEEIHSDVLLYRLFRFYLRKVRQALEVVSVALGLEKHHFICWQSLWTYCKYSQIPKTIALTSSKQI